jgi:hypothetical protein
MKTSIHGSLISSSEAGESTTRSYAELLAHCDKADPIEVTSTARLPFATRLVIAVLAIATWAISRPASATGIPNTFASAIAIDKANRTITLPLFRGQVAGKGRVFFVLTESSDFNDAVARGINWSPK